MHRAAAFGWGGGSQLVLQMGVLLFRQLRLHVLQHLDHLQTRLLCWLIFEKAQTLMTHGTDGKQPKTDGNIEQVRTRNFQTRAAAA